MSSPYAPIIVIYLIAGFINLALAVITWRQHDQPGHSLWVMVLLCVVLWSTSNVVKLFNPDDLMSNLVTARANHIAVMAIIYFWWMFALHYTNRDKWLTPRFKLIFASISVIAYLLFLFDRSGLFYNWYSYVDVDGLTKWDATFGVVGTVWVIYGYLILIASLVLIVRYVWSMPNLYRMQAVLITLAIGLPVFGNAVQVLGFMSGFVDFTPILFTLTGILMFIATQRFEFLRLVPVAYDTIYHNISNGVLIVNTDGRIVRMNPAAESILGISQSTSVGQLLQTIYPQYYDLIMRASREQVSNIELQLGNPVRTYALQVNPLSSQTVRMGYVIMLLDITERQLAAEERSRRLLEEERTRILTTFITKAAHEFRTPLSVIKSGQYLIGRVSDSEKVKALVNRNDEQVDAISHLVDNLLLMTQVDNPHAALDLQKIDWNDCVRMVVDRQRTTATECGITLIHEVDSTTPSVHVDEELMSRALRELLDNAIRHSPQNSTVRIVCSAPQCTVKFIDEGTGISESDQPHIFERFYRVDASHNTRGFGLGLPIARAVAERHNGRVELESSSEKGSVFSLWIPAEPLKS